MKTKRILALLLSVMMVLGMMPMTAFAYHEESFFDGDSVDVCTEGKTYSLFTEDNLEEQDGTTFLYVVKKGDRYYTLGNPRYTEFKEVDSVFAVDITEYYDAQTNSFSGISDNVNIGAMQYQMSAGSYMYVDGNMLLALSVPFESEGETWFEGGIRYYSLDNTYSYNRPFIADGIKVFRTVKISGQGIIKILHALGLCVFLVFFKREGRAFSHNISELTRIKAAAAKSTATHSGSTACHISHRTGTVIRDGCGYTHSVKRTFLGAFRRLSYRKTDASGYGDHERDNADQNVSTFGSTNAPKRVFDNVHG